MNILFHRVTHIPVGLLALFHLAGYCQGHQGVNASILSNFQGHRSNDAELSTSRADLPEAISIDTKGDVSAATDGKSTRMFQDSIEARTYPLPEVVVTSARIQQTSSYSPSSVTVFTRNEIESMNATSLAQVVSAAAGIFIKDYGSISGLKTISQRGLGTEHTLILFNGLRMSSLQNGLVDLGMLPIDNIESVEIVRGGQSASYGADAVAGLINVVTRPEHGRSGIQAMSSIGSFGYRRYQVSGNLSSNNDAMRLSYGEEKSVEDFPFQFHNGPLLAILNRHNSDLFARHAGLSGALGIGEVTRLSLFASTYFSERGVPGAVVSQFSTARAQQTDKDHILQTSLSSDISENARLGIAVQFHSAYERYEDPGLNIGGICSIRTSEMMTSVLSRTLT